MWRVYLRKKQILRDIILIQKYKLVMIIQLLYSRDIFNNVLILVVLINYKLLYCTDNLINLIGYELKIIQT